MAVFGVFAGNSIDKKDVFLVAKQYLLCIKAFSAPHQQEGWEVYAQLGGDRAG